MASESRVSPASERTFARASEKMLSSSSESEFVFTCRHMPSTECLSVLALVRLPLCAMQRPYGKLV
jgi:hypothetical protein